MSVLSISLDFELLWGIFDKKTPAKSNVYFSQTREAVPRMLELFQAYGVEVTWATVGMLMAADEEEWLSYNPQLLPDYKDQNFCPYAWVKLNGIYAKMHFAPDLVQKILDTPGQELGSHTYSHFYTQESGQTPEKFAADLKAAQKISQNKFNQALKSLVFPRNQYSEEYLRVCAAEGFTSVRTNPNDWFWKDPASAGFLKKLVRAGDTFFPLGKQTSYTLADITPVDGMPIELPASRFFRPVEKRLPVLNTLRSSRIQKEMTHAAKNDLIYHLWWHPHNFGNNTAQNLQDLETLLKHYKTLHDQYGMQSLNMGNLAQMVIDKTSVKRAV